MFDKSLALSPIDLANANQFAASHPQTSVFVNASAGTGKTKVLCDRFLRLLLTGTPAQNIFCVTFTTYAAKEMLERILNKVSTWHSLQRDKLIAEISSLLQGLPTSPEIERAENAYINILEILPKLKIQTLHSFCHNLLNKYLQPKDTEIKILDQSESLNLYHEAFDEIMRFASHKQGLLNEAFNTLIEYYNVYEIKERIQAACFNTVKLKKIFDELKNEYLIQNEIFKLHGVDLKDKSLTEDAINKDMLNIPQQFLNYIKEFALEFYQKVLNSRDKANEYINIYFTKDLQPRAHIIKKSILEKHFELPQLLKDETTRLEILITKKKALISAKVNSAFLIFCYHILERLEELKTLNKKLNFDDLQLQTMELLTNSPNADFILYNLDFQVDHILVDEAQDLSPLQWELIKTLTADFYAGSSARNLIRTLFIVGDFKQSIFGFQGAEPNIFFEMREYFKEKITASRLKWEEIDMNVSFRSCVGVLKFVDSTFKTFHIPFRTLNGEVKIWPLISKKPPSEINGWDIPIFDKSEDNPEQIHAQQIAFSINQWFNDKRLIQSRDREIQPEDIMILVRKRSSLSFKIVGELRKLNINASDQNRIRLNEDLVIWDLLSIIKFILFPHDELNLAALLKSPFFNINEEKLFEILHLRSENLYLRLNKFPDIKSKLISWQKLSKTLPLTSFYENILYTENNLRNFIGRFGEYGENIIETFLSILYKYEEDYGDSMFEFLDCFINSELITNTQKNNKDAVRILTVHAAKGLEAPIVILADAASSEYSPYENVIWNDKTVTFPLRKELNSNFTCKLLEKNKEKTKQENLSLLYVALTRAQDELHITGIDNLRLKGSWYDILSRN